MNGVIKMYRLSLNNTSVQIVHAPFHCSEQVIIFNKWKRRSLLEQEVIFKNNDLPFNLSDHYDGRLVLKQ